MMKQVKTTLLFLIALLMLIGCDSDDSENNGNMDPDTPVAEGPFITMWEVEAGSSITIPTLSDSYTYKYKVNWGDGSETEETGDATHTYTLEGTYKVSIEGEFPAISFWNTDGANRLKFKSVEQWGGIEWATMESAFHSASFTLNATDAPILTNVESTVGMFALGGVSFGEGVNLNSWDVSNVKNMVGMFNQQAGFNEDISGWDVSNVTSMDQMFEACFSFNQDLSGWNVSNVTSMSDMFNNATAFNQNLSGWNVSKVTNVEYMFSNANSFSQDLSDWDVSKVTKCTNFAPNLGSAQRPNFPAGCE